MKTKIWYAMKAGNDYQGLVAEDGTGRNVAVTYDVKDAHLVAVAPELLEALENLLDDVEYAKDKIKPGLIGNIQIRKARAAIAKAKGE